MVSNVSIGRAELPERATPAHSVRIERGDGSVVRLTSEDELRKAEITGQEVPVGEEQLIRAIDRAIKAMQGPQTRLDFSVHDETKKLMVKVINKDSGETIREIPQEKSLDFLAKLWEMTGILIDERR